MTVTSITILPKTSQPNIRLRVPEKPKACQVEARHAVTSTRTRRKHQKVRTGCLTCKIRRKKCDETRPSCRRCAESSRQCDGYGSERSSEALRKASESLIQGRLAELSTKTSEQGKKTMQNRTQRRLLVPLVPTTIDRSPGNFIDFGSGAQISDLEMHCFSLFRYRTGRQFAAYFDSTLWRDYSNYLALTHPVVFACAAALGAVHRRFLLGISREAFEYCAHADKLYRRAASLLKQLEDEVRDEDASASNLDRDVLMCSHFFLGLFQSFQGNLGQCVSRMNEGMKCLLDRPMTLLHKESQYVAADEAGDLYGNIIRQLHQKTAGIFGSSHVILAQFSGGGTLPEMPPEFESLEQARDLLFTELNWIMSTPNHVWSVPQQYKDAQRMHISRLLKWSVAYANTVEKMDRTHSEKLACMLLKQTRNATFLLLYLTMYVYAERHVQDWMDDRGADFEQFDQGIWSDTADSLFRIQGWRNQYGNEYDLGQDIGDKLGLELDHANKLLWTVVAHRQELSTKLECLKVLCESRLNDNSPFNYLEHSVSFDSGVGPPLSTVAEPDSSSKTRHAVQSMLRKTRTSIDDDLSWLGVYGIAEKLSSIEEHAVVTAAKSILPKNLNPTWVDFSYFAENRRLLLRYCHPDEANLGMRWIQEWWAF